MSTTPEITDELHRRLNELAEKVATLHWDLGGLTYEMAIRDHFRLDVLMRQAGRLQEIDARLGEVEHLLRLDTTGAAGACPQCGTLYARGALFCSQCAFQLVGVQQVGAPMTPPPPPSPHPHNHVHVPLADETAPDAPLVHAGDEDEMPTGLREPRAEDTQPPGASTVGRGDLAAPHAEDHTIPFETQEPPAR
jgi:hypothetical protein